MEQRRVTPSAILLLKTRDQTIWSEPHFRGDRIMSGIIVGAAAASIAAAATVIVAALPDAQALLSPLTEGSNEYAIAAASVLASLPMPGNHERFGHLRSRIAFTAPPLPPPLFASSPVPWPALTPRELAFFGAGDSASRSRPPARACGDVWVRRTPLRGAGPRRLATFGDRRASARLRSAERATGAVLATSISSC